MTAGDQMLGTVACGFWPSTTCLLSWSHSMGAEYVMMYIPRHCAARVPEMVKCSAGAVAAARAADRDAGAVAGCDAAGEANFMTGGAAKAAAGRNAARHNKYAFMSFSVVCD